MSNSTLTRSTQNSNYVDTLFNYKKKGNNIFVQYSDIVFKNAAFK